MYSDDDFSHELIFFDFDGLEVYLFERFQNSRKLWVRDMGK